MTPAAKPVPERLARAGIRRVSDNLPEGAALSIVASEFLRFFRPEIEASGLIGLPQSKSAAPRARLTR